MSLPTCARRLCCPRRWNLGSRGFRPLVPCCAGTGLSGGASPIADGVVQPGVRNLAISDAAAAHGLYYAPDPSSQIACTIGGNVAENSGGEHCTEVRADLL